MGLEMRERCERCSARLVTDSGDAFICSHECTFCRTCAEELDELCPNCGGELVARPRRALALALSAPRGRRRAP